MITTKIQDLQELSDELDSFFSQFSQTKFKHGQSNVNYCDCIGLPIQYYKSKGYDVSWEADLPRELVRYQGLRQLILSLPFRLATDEEIKNQVTLYLWMPGEVCAHIGMMVPEYLSNKTDNASQLVYHVGQAGLMREYIYPETGENFILLP